MNLRVTFLLLFATSLLWLAAEAPFKVDANVIDTLRHTITVAPTGLPAQLSIKADSRELPLAARGKPVSEGVLQAIGRGDQLRAPVKLIIVSNGKETVATAVEPAQLKMAEGKATAVSSLSAGTINIKLLSSWSASGQVDYSFTLTGETSESVYLQFELAGPVDFAVAGNATDKKLRVYKPREFGFKAGEGVIWANAGEGAPKGRSKGDHIAIFVGSGDRGFTWLAPGAGKRLDRKKASAHLLRDKSGQLTWRLYLLNSKTKFNKAKDIAVSLQTHPTTMKPKDFRLKAWTTDASKLGDSYAIVSGSTGGDAVSRQQHMATTYPIYLHRFLLGSHTGTAAQIKTNSSALVRAGQRPGTDWMSLGRALLHDCGLDARGIANLSEAATVVKAIEHFGAFKSDGKSEFIPYWRSSQILRYGETFASVDAFALSREDPMSHVHVSLWRRPHSNTGKAMFVIVNESDKAVRKQFYILKPELLFGRGGNQMRAKKIVEGLKYTSIPAESDWRKERLANNVLSHAGDKDSDVALLDMTDSGFVVRPSAKDGIEVYGPIYIPARSYRILYGAGR
jgi:hypothetical protein